MPVIQTRGASQTHPSARHSRGEHLRQHPTFDVFSLRLKIDRHGATCCRRCGNFANRGDRSCIHGQWQGTTVTDGRGARVTFPGSIVVAHCTNATTLASVWAASAVSAHPPKLTPCHDQPAVPLVRRGSSRVDAWCRTLNEVQREELAGKGHCHTPTLEVSALLPATMVDCLAWRRDSAASNKLLWGPSPHTEE